MTRLKQLVVRGYRSIREAELSFGPRTLLIGPNGSGKSNLLSVLRLIPMIASRSLGVAVGNSDGASALLFRGPKVTPQLELSVTFQQNLGENIYHCRLGRTGDDSLLFLEERAAFRAKGLKDFQWVDLGAGHRESTLEQSTHPTCKWVLSALRRLNFFHFHDTSTHAALRTPSRPEDSRDLRSDGSNLPSYLLSLMEAEDEESRAAWRRIQATVRQIAPFIKVLSPTLTANQRTVRLDWTDDLDDLYSAQHLSDGTLRAIALITAMGQPSKRLPSFISIDEPELGLHPAALEVLMGLARTIEQRCDLLLATQSTELLDYFEPEEVIVTERTPQGSSFRRVDPTQLQEWLNDFTLSELFHRNILGGGGKDRGAVRQGTLGAAPVGFRGIWNSTDSPNVKRSTNTPGT